MKPCAFTKQSLLDHSISSYEIASKLISNNYYKVIVNRLNKVGISLKEEEVKELVKDAILLHDIGKTGEYYQEKFDDECNPKTSNPSFIYHEIGSALFFYYDYDANEKVRELLALSAINHLNAIRGIGDLSLNKLQGFQESMIHLKKYGSLILEKLKEKGLITKNVKVEDYSFDEFSDMLYAFAKKSNYTYLKLYNLFLAPVMIGDNLDSSLVRLSDKKSRFVRLLEGEIIACSTL